MINVKFLDLPGRVKAVATENEDCSFTIVINSKLNYEQQVKSYKHELSHINNDDFSKNNVQSIESDAHSRKED